MFDENVEEEDRHAFHEVLVLALLKRTGRLQNYDAMRGRLLWSNRAVQLSSKHLLEIVMEHNQPILNGNRLSFWDWLADRDSSHDFAACLDWLTVLCPHPQNFLLPNPLMDLEDAVAEHVEARTPANVPVMYRIAAYSTINDSGIIHWMGPQLTRSTFPNEA